MERGLDNKEPEASFKVHLPLPYLTFFYHHDSQFLLVASGYSELLFCILLSSMYKSALVFLYSAVSLLACTVFKLKTHIHVYKHKQNTCKSDHKELAEGDVREDVVRLVLATGLAGLLPEVRQLLEQRPTGSKV